jgi:uncharacterized protein (TIGR02186 family)
MRRLLFTLLVLLMGLGPALAERLVTNVSRTEVSITSSFAGEQLTLFGNIEPEVGAALPWVEGPYHVVIVVTGPLQNRVARKKSNVFGIWLNTQQVLFERFPSFFHVLSDTAQTNITSPLTLAELHMLPEQQARMAARAGWWDAITFGDELVRLMKQAKLFGVNTQGVVFRSNTFYSAQVNLGSDAPPGPYLAHTYLFKGGQLIAERSDRFSVRKIGFERFLGLAAVQQPLLYGVFAVILALFTGWLGGVVFKR